MLHVLSGFFWCILERQKIIGKLERDFFQRIENSPNNRDRNCSLYIYCKSDPLGYQIGQYLVLNPYQWDKFGDRRELSDNLVPLFLPSHAAISARGGEAVSIIC